MTGRLTVGPLGPVLPLAGLTVLAEVAYPLVRGTGRDVLTVLTVLLFAAASLAHAAVSRGARVALLVLAVLAGGGLLADAVGVATGYPFGEYRFAGRLGAAVLDVPLVIPLGWLMLGWPAYLVATRLTAGSGRPARILVAGWALASWDLFLDPQLVAAGHWRWATPEPALPGVPGVPLTNYAGWLLVSVALMAVLDAALRPADRVSRPADLLPYGLYLWTYASSVLALAALFDLPAAAVWGGLGMGLVAVPLARSVRTQTPAGIGAR